MEKKLTKNEKGITLVALIITIIVLLILAVVSIRAITGDNILGKAESAKGKYSEGEEEEKVKLAVQEAAIDGIGTIEKTHLENSVTNMFKPVNTSVSESGDDFLVTIESSENEYLVSKDGNITKKAPSNIKYVFGNEGQNDYIVILKNNNVFYATRGQKIPFGTYATNVDVTTLPAYSENQYEIEDRIKALNSFILADGGKLAYAISNDKSTLYVIEHSMGSNSVRIKDIVGQLMNNVDLSEYEF